MAKQAVKQAPEVKKAQKVLIRAVEMTKKELKSKEIKKTEIHYPKGVYKATLKKNFAKAALEAGLKKGKTAKKKAPAKKK